MQNSLDRLLAGIATSLRDSVLPELTDPYARSQVSAAIELLGNLAVRVDWRRDQIEALVERIRSALLAAGKELPPRTADPLADRETHLTAVAGAAGDDEIDPAVKDALMADLAAELTLLRAAKDMTRGDRR